MAVDVKMKVYKLERLQQVVVLIATRNFNQLESIELLPSRIIKRIWKLYEFAERKKKCKFNATEDIEVYWPEQID